MNTESIGDAGPVLRASERMFARVRTLLALRGVVAIAFAVTLLVWPGIGLTAMVWVVGVFAIASGFVSAAAALALPGAAKRRRFWLALHGVVGLLTGAAVLLWPDISVMALLYALALWAITVGVIELLAAFVLPLSGPRTALVTVGGIALVAIGVVMFVEPGDGAVGLLALMAACGLVRGTSDVALAVQLRHVADELDQSVRSLTAVTPAAHG